MPSIAANLQRVRSRIAQSAERAGRDPAQITLVAVVKGRPLDQVRELLDCGQRLFAENRIQEARSTIPQLPSDIEWHFIGHLQKNKAKDAVRLFSMIHSLDSLELAQVVNKIAERERRLLDCLIELNISGEETKQGLDPRNVLPLLEQAPRLPHLRLRGLMTMAPHFPNPEDTRPVFHRLRLLRDRLAAYNLPGIFLDHLSMGMTNDFEIAIEEGATMVRIGTALFDES